MKNSRVKTASSLSYIDLGLQPYQEVWNKQEELRRARLEGRVGDTIIFCEHPAVYTIGRQDCSEDILASLKTIGRDGIEIVRCNRGGRITYHGPGQLVVYFIVKISNYSLGVKDFVSKVEGIGIDFVTGFGLKARRHEKYPGIWIGSKKVAAIGLNISQGVSLHGMSINVDPDLTHYRHIVPCGIKEYGITSLAKELGVKLSVDEVRGKLLQSVSKVLV